MMHTDLNGNTACIILVNDNKMQHHSACNANSLSLLDQHISRIRITRAVFRQLDENPRFEIRLCALTKCKSVQVSVVVSILLFNRSVQSF